ncbi:hypothetical protein EV385_0303 [Krasilnikovia cinnamomea]|uniref:Uncharacterized protein n=1 Tax=Krasilnikovia cinnamomea TaxID=349313 RepID=A0A4V2G6F7_9ACTN|nr:hypothetical protein [Krasilnikovia cinnamomea]RZU48586.1 hypothetical protein EV385_0303 [Krasilnikovia cinnamomea]
MTYHPPDDPERIRYAYLVPVVPGSPQPPPGPVTPEAGNVAGAAEFGQSPDARHRWRARRLAPAWIADLVGIAAANFTRRARGSASRLGG